MNKNILTTVVAATLGVAGSAHALEAKLSGQINRALMYVNDGFLSELHHVDNINSGTRFRFTGTDELEPGIKAGVTFEVEMTSNPSSSVSQTAKSNTPALAERIQEVYFTGGFGMLSMGQGLGAADGGIEVDLSGTFIANSSLGTSAVGGGMVFKTNTGGTGPALSTTLGNQDFEGRYDRLRYDTPVFGPVKIAVSTGTKADTANEAAVWLNADLGGAGKLAGAIGYSQLDTNVVTTGKQEIKGLSLSWLAGFGLNVTGAFSNVEDEAAGDAQKDSTFKYLKVGYKVGAHAIAIDYGVGEDFAVRGDESKMVGIGYVYAPKPWADFYAGAKVHSLDRPGGATVGTGVAAAAAEFDEIKVVMVGSRLKF